MTLSPVLSILGLARCCSLGAAMARRVARSFSPLLRAAAAGGMFARGNGFPIARDRLPQGSAGLVVFEAARHGETSFGLVGATLARVFHSRHHVSLGGATC